MKDKRNDRAKLAKTFLGVNLYGLFVFFNDPSFLDMTSLMGILYIGTFEMGVTYFMAKVLKA